MATKGEFSWGAYGGGDLAQPTGAADFTSICSINVNWRTHYLLNIVIFFYLVEATPAMRSVWFSRLLMVTALMAALLWGAWWKMRLPPPLIEPVCVRGG